RRKAPCCERRSTPSATAPRASPATVRSSGRGLPESSAPPPADGRRTTWRPEATVERRSWDPAPRGTRCAKPQSCPPGLLQVFNVATNLLRAWTVRLARPRNFERLERKLMRERVLRKLLGESRVLGGHPRASQSRALPLERLQRTLIPPLGQKQLANAPESSAIFRVGLASALAAKHRTVAPL